MGCCIGIRNNSFTDKDFFIKPIPKEKRDFMITSKSNSNKKLHINKNYRKSSSKTTEASHSNNSYRIKNNENLLNSHNKMIKDISKELRLITILECKNIRKFFALK